MSAFEELRDDLVQGIIRARERVYTVGKTTPLERIRIPALPVEPWIKREDLGPIKAYKWRGAFNAIAALTKDQRERGIVAASAGNHAQGVALACKRLQCKATIFMPRSTPIVKQREVARHGGDMVTIILHGDSYDEASAAAYAFRDEHHTTYVHPYNDLNVIAGQGTMADEIIMSGEGPFDRVYIAIGGGGLASATACWLKYYWPEIEVIGVEGVDQASMKAAIAAGKPVELSYVDVFCDGTAVRKVGDNTHLLCSHLIDRIVTVTNEEVCDAVRMLWEANRIIPEPSGAMGLAGMIKDHETKPIQNSEKVLTVLCGANMDFTQIGKIAQGSSFGKRKRFALRIGISDGHGTLIHLLESLPAGVNIIDLQYGRNQLGAQYPVITFAANDAEQREILSSLSEHTTEEVSQAPDVLYRVIPFQNELVKHPEFVVVEFPERAGALREFMRQVSAFTSLFYFNYSYSGERVGRALIGMDFANAEQKTACFENIKKLEGSLVRSVKKMEEESAKRLLGISD